MAGISPPLCVIPLTASPPATRNGRAAAAAASSGFLPQPLPHVHPFPLAPIRTPRLRVSRLGPNPAPVERVREMCVWSWCRGYCSSDGARRHGAPACVRMPGCRPCPIACRPPERASTAVVLTRQLMVLLVCSLGSSCLYLPSWPRSQTCVPEHTFSRCRTLATRSSMAPRTWSRRPRRSSRLTSVNRPSPGVSTGAAVPPVPLARGRGKLRWSGGNWRCGPCCLEAPGRREPPC